MSDKHLTENSNILSHITPGDILADRRYDTLSAGLYVQLLLFQTSQEEGSS